MNYELVFKCELTQHCKQQLLKAEVVELDHHTPVTNPAQD